MKKYGIYSLLLFLVSFPSFASRTQPNPSSQFHIKRPRAVDHVRAQRNARPHRPLIGNRSVKQAPPLSKYSAKRPPVKRSRRFIPPSIPNPGLVSAMRIPLLGEDDDNTTLVMGDFNGDGKKDFAKIVYDSGDIYSISAVLNNGDGTFQTAQLTTTPANSDDPIIVGDLNGDGKDDLIIVHCDSQPSTFDILLSNGDGTFTLGHNYTVSSTYLNGGLLTDFNADGKLDFLAVDAANPANVVSLLGNGDGTFQAVSTVTALATAAPGNLVFADFNADGKLDIAGTAGGQVSVYLASGATFLAAVPLVTSDTVYDACNATAGDLTGDSKPEIVAVNCEDNTLTIFVNNGDGTFQTGVYYNNLGDANSSPNSPVIADLNGDGNGDIVVGNTSDGTLSVFLGNGDGTVTLEPVGFVTGGYPWNPVFIADFDGDGIADIMADDDWFSLVFLKGYGDGYFRAALNYYLPDSFGLDAYSYAIAAGDFDGDGIPDAVVGQEGNTNSPGVAVYLSKGDGSFKAPVSYGTATDVTSIVVADFNGDNKLDIAATDYSTGTVQIFLGVGDGTFTVGESYATDTASNPYPISIVAGDFNKDGKMDLAIANSDTNSVGVLFGAGDGTFGSLANYPLSEYPNAITAADLNGDGHLDLALTMSTDGPSVIGILLSNNDNTGTFQAETDYAIDGNPMFLAFGDLNLDGKLDMVVTDSWGDTYPSQIEIALGNGDGTFQAATVYPSSALSTFNLQARPAHVQLFDFNNDGNLDILYLNSEFSSVAIMYGVGDGTVLPPVEYPTTEYPWGMVLADVNNDGAMDVLTANDETGGVTALLNDSGTGVVPDYSVAAPTSTATVTAGTPATYTLNLAGKNGYDGVISFACTGLPAKSTCSFNPATVIARGFTPLSTVVTIHTTASSSAALASPALPISRPGSTLFYASLSGMGLFGMLLVAGGRKRRAGLLLALALLLIAVTFVGCGGSSTKTVVNTGTPAGQYSVVVTATGTGANAPTHSLSLTLVVQ